MDKIDETVDSKFRFVLVAAKRAEQLMQGARPRVETDATKIARSAMDEILGGEVEWDYGPAPEAEEPEELELEAADEDAVDEAN